MVIYIEIYLIINIFIQILTTIFIYEIAYVKLRKFIILAIIINLIYSLLYIYKPEYVLILKYVMPLIFVFLSYKTNIYNYLKLSLIYYFISFSLGGMAYILNFSGNLLYFIVFIFYFFILVLYYIFFKRKRISILYKISFNFKNKKYLLNAFYDTGANLYYKNKPVLVLNSKYHFGIKSFEKLYIENGYSNSFNDLYYIDQLRINNSLISAYCIFLDIKYDALIGSNFLWQFIILYFNILIKRGDFICLIG